MKKWFLLAVMTYTAFVFNTAEFIPIGLLTDIASDFSVSEAHASLLISVYAWFVALMSLPLMLAVGKYDFKKILLSIIALFVLSHILSAIAPNFFTLTLSRLGVACAHAIFWSIITPLAIQIAPKGKQETAMGMIITGTSIAMIAGMPLGRIIGLHLGWRFSFTSIGLAALLAFLLLAFLFPTVPNRQRISVKTLPAILKTPAVLSLYVFTFLVVTAHYTGYSYIEPFLKQVAGLTDSQITLSLTLFGVAGVASSALFSRYYHQHSILFWITLSASFAFVMLIMRYTAFIPCASMMHCVLWGLTFTAFNLVTEFEIIRHSPQYSTIAVALYSSIFNIGIGCGAVTGGACLTKLTISNIGYAGGIIALFALFLVFKKLLPSLHSKNR